jgi:hypothetical protein
MTELLKSLSQSTLKLAVFTFLYKCFVISVHMPSKFLFTLHSSFLYSVCWFCWVCRGGVARDDIDSVITAVSVGEYNYDIQFFILQEIPIDHSVVLSHSIMRQRVLIRHQMSRLVGRIIKLHHTS